MKGTCPKCDSIHITDNGFDYDTANVITATCDDCEHTAERKYFEPYYQPIPIDGIENLVTVDGNELFSFQVYGDKEICEDDFPHNEIKEFNGTDIEEPTFVDS